MNDNIQRHNLYFLNISGGYVSNSYCFKVGDVVFFNIDISSSTASIPDGSAKHICLLPVGFRPERQHRSVAIVVAGDKTRSVASIDVASDGKIRFFSNHISNVYTLIATGFYLC